MAENKTEVKKKQDTEITLDTIVQRDPDQEFSKIDNEIVMLSLKHGEYYALNEVASRIWVLIKNRISIKELIAKLLIEYNVPKDQCEIDTIECLMDFKRKNLIN